MMSAGSHWQEKDVALWARSWLERTFGPQGVRIPLTVSSLSSKQDGTAPKAGLDSAPPDIVLSFIGCTANGDATLHSKKQGAPLQAVFEFQLSIDWKCSCAVANGRVEVKGCFSAREFGSEDMEDFELQCNCDEPSKQEAALFSDPGLFKSLAQQLHSAVKKQGLKEVRSLLTENFVKEMLGEGSRNTDSGE
ncbi:unnamed protein product [Amoebophrya sp. A25]|nr:unnamed protein product [Amoebophrya sp. A25]|eukprot:GSA25T00009887001.1